MVVGLMSLFAPYLLTHGGIEIFRWGFAGCFITAAILLAGNTILSRLTRRQVTAYKSAEDKKPKGEVNGPGSDAIDAR
jgi:hypothetical protein